MTRGFFNHTDLNYDQLSEYQQRMPQHNNTVIHEHGAYNRNSRKDGKYPQTLTMENLHSFEFIKQGYQINKEYLQASQPIIFEMSNQKTLGQIYRMFSKSPDND